MIKRALTRQWSFFWAGISFGIAQIIYMIGVLGHAVQSNRRP